MHLLVDQNLFYYDEMTAGLDAPVGAKIIKTTSQHIKQQNITANLTSHYLEDLESLTERVVVLKEGAVIKNQSLETFRNRFSSNVIKLRCAYAKELIEKLGSGELYKKDTVIIKTDNPDEVLRKAYKTEQNFELLSKAQSSLAESYSFRL